MPFIQSPTPATTEFSQDDQILLALGLTLISLADGALDDEEEILFNTYKATLPDWRELMHSTEFQDALESKVQAVVAHYQALGLSPQENPHTFALTAIEQLSAIRHPHARLRCFFLALDVAMASGGISPNEDLALLRIASVLALTSEEIKAITYAIGIKYACLPTP